MTTLFVVDAEGDWPAALPGVAVATAKDYLTGPACNNGDYSRVVNLCRCDKPNGAGFYVSLLAEARGHEPLPAAKTLADLRAAPAAHEIRALEAPRRAPASPRPAIAILHTPSEPLPPSNPAALQSFLRAARELGMQAELIDRRAIDRLEGFDALFIRDTTRLDHYTYRFARRAQALGLVVIDDPESIVRCNNKVYLNELLSRNGVPVPRTLMVHNDNVGEVAETLGLPCILKQPDSGFSLGVRKVRSEEELRREAAALLAKSELIVAQAYLPTHFDWRVGVLDRRLLYVCKYFMAPGHWQIHKYERGRHLEGQAAALSVGEAPQAVVTAALRAANLIGDGLYGVDVKQVGEQCYVMEINDNPNLDAGNEDEVLNEALYREVMGVFLRRIRERKATVGA